jgi:hypothetical protein
MLYYPAAVAYDPAGNLVIADEQNDRIRRVVLHPTKLNATLGYDSSGTTLTATYSGLSFGIAPTGSVTFMNGSTSLGTAEIVPASDGSGNYVATLSGTAAPAGGATLTAQYSGDGNYASVSATATFQPVTSSYSVSANPASLAIKQGSSGSITFTITPHYGFNQTVSFGCESTTLPKGVTCSFSPASVTPNGSAVTTTLTLQTTGTSSAAISRKLLSGWVPGGGAALALMLLGMPGVRRRALAGGSACVLLILCFAGGLAGCGGGGSNSGSGSTQNANATPPGSYTVQVTTTVGTLVDSAPGAAVSLTVTQ